MRVLAASVLLFEAIVVALAIPAALALGSAGPAAVGWWFGAAAVGCLLAAGLLRRRAGYVLGSVLQVAVVASGVLLPAMYLLGGLFAALWVLALVIGRRGERIRAERSASPGGPADAG